MENQSELYYNILKECVGNNKITAGEIAEKLNLISEDDIALVTLQELKFIKRTNSFVELLPQGFATYLAISSQKQSNEQAQKATEQAIKAINYAKYALCISIVSFVVSVIFSILQLVLK